MHKQEFICIACCAQRLASPCRGGVKIAEFDGGVYGGIEQYNRKCYMITPQTPQSPTVTAPLQGSQGRSTSLLR